MAIWIVTFEIVYFVGKYFPYQIDLVKGDSRSESDTRLNCNFFLDFFLSLIFYILLF